MSGGAPRVVFWKCQAARVGLSQRQASYMLQRSLSCTELKSHQSLLRETPHPSSTTSLSPCSWFFSGIPTCACASDMRRSSIIFQSGYAGQTPSQYVREGLYTVFLINFMGHTPWYRLRPRRPFPFYTEHPHFISYAGYCLEFLLFFKILSSEFLVSCEFCWVAVASIITGNIAFLWFL